VTRVLTRVRLLAASSHPGPTVVVTLLAVVLAVALAYGPGRVLAVAATVFVGQLSIGFANDWIDADRDRMVGRADKPVARGLIAAGTVRTAALVCAALTFVASFALGLPAGIAHVVLVGSGWAYDGGLKRTPLSVVPFVLSFGLLPAVVTLAGPHPVWPATWCVATGAVFGIAIHFTNVLPDLADDRATGVVGLPHRLGRRRTGVVAFLALVAAAALVLVGQGVGPDAVAGVRLTLAVTGAALTAVIAIAGMAVALTRPPTRLLFRLVMAASVLLVVQLAFSGTRLIA